MARDYFYYLGPWVWVSEKMGGCWTSPKGTVGLIDLRTVPQMSVAGGKAQGQGFFATTEVLDDSYELIYKGDIESTEGKATLDILWNKLTIDSDPTGLTAPKPLMPDSSMNLDLCLGGHSIVRREKFQYGVHSHTSKVREVLQECYREEKSKDTGSKNYLKVLDFLGEKYGIAKPEDEFIPANLPKEKPIKHNTVINESFNTADSSTLGPDLSWTELAGNINIVSNQARTATTGESSARANSDLSSADHYAQAVIDVSAETNSPDVGVITRKDSSATLTYYLHTADFPSNGTRSYKCVNGTYTAIGTENSTTLTAGTPATIKGISNGSTIEVFINGTSRLSHTDTAITANVRCGIRGYKTVSGYVSWDSFEAGDIVTKSCALTGTVTSSITEADIVAGSKTLILTVTGDTYVASGATFDAQRQNIINGIDSAQAEATGWDAVVKAGLAVTDVVRTSDTVVTITLPAFAPYNITATETITATVPSTALTGAAALVASPTFTVSAVSSAVVRMLAMTGVGV